MSLRNFWFEPAVVVVAVLTGPIILGLLQPFFCYNTGKLRTYLQLLKTNKKVNLLSLRLIWFFALRLIEIVKQGPFTCYVSCIPVLSVWRLRYLVCFLLPSPHLLVLATSERFLPTWDTFRAILANESHWLQPVLVLSVHWWPAPAGVGSVYVSPPSTD
jgi:hypothetical protein